MSALDSPRLASARPASGAGAERRALRALRRADTCGPPAPARPRDAGAAVLVPRLLAAVRPRRRGRRPLPAGAATGGCGSPASSWTTSPGSELRIPVDMAFFFRNSAAGRVMAFYPSPMGPTESLLELSTWDELERANPVLLELEPDVEALLVEPRTRRAAAVARADRRLLRARGRDPHALARLHRRPRGVAGDRPLLRRRAGPSRRRKGA